jgi:hypothetical protein
MDSCFSGMLSTEVIALIMASVKLVSSATIHAFGCAPVVCMVYIMCKKLQDLVALMSIFKQELR